VARFAVILPAAGKSSRFKDDHYKKPFSTLDGRAVWMHAAEKFLNREDCVQVILVISPDDREMFDLKFSANVALLGVEVVNGGAERADSVQNALARVKPDVEFVAIHDAARPCIANEWVTAVFDKAKQTGAALLAIPVNGTLKRVGANHEIEETVPRANLWEAQTPQVFRRDLLLEAYAKRDGFNATDDAQLVERIGQAVTVVTGSPLNIKITTKGDLKFAEACLKALPKPKLGFSHPFDDDDKWR
jgi:2-C-methyl-D-erythritol 4-phosphate cytidylyltransferase